MYAGVWMLFAMDLFRWARYYNKSRYVTKEDIIRHWIIRMYNQIPLFPFRCFSRESFFYPCFGVIKRGASFQRGEYCSFYEAELCIGNYCATWFHMRHVPLCARCTRYVYVYVVCDCVSARDSMNDFYAISCAFTNTVCMPQTTVTLNIRNIIMLLDAMWICVSCMSLLLSACVCVYVCVCLWSQKNVIRKKSPWDCFSFPFFSSLLLRSGKVVESLILHADGIFNEGNDVRNDYCTALRWHCGIQKLRCER